MLDPKSFGLTSRTVLEEYDGGVAIVMDRKSRIVMADGQRILAKAEKLRASVGDVAIVLKTLAPVCSKTKLFLDDREIVVLPL